MRRGHPDFPGAMLVPIGAGWVPLRLKEIARQVHQHDPNLTLEVRCDAKTQKPLCIDLFERDRNGTEHWVTRWSMEEMDRIIPDIHRSDRLAPGHESVTVGMRKTNEAKQAAAIAEGVDVLGEFYERVEGVKRDMAGEKTFHGQTGFGPSPIEKKLIIVERPQRVKEKT